MQNLEKREYAKHRIAIANKQQLDNMDLLYNFTAGDWSIRSAV